MLRAYSVEGIRQYDPRWARKDQEAMGSRRRRNEPRPGVGVVIREGFPEEELIAKMRPDRWAGVIQEWGISTKTI